MANTIITIVIIAAVIAAIAVFFLYRTGMKMQAEQAQNQQLLESYAQVTTLLVIDKKKMKLKDAPFPPEVYEQAGWRGKITSVYVVRAKVGAKIVDLMCPDKDMFEDIPVNATIKAKISGIILMEILKGAQPSEKNIQKRRKAREKAARKAAKG